MQPGIPATKAIGDDPRRQTVLQRQTTFLHYFATIGAIAIAYVVMAKLSFSVLELGVEPSPVWPPAGLSLAALALFGIKAWPGIALGAFLFNQSLDVSWLLAAGSAFSNTLQALVGIILLRHLKIDMTLGSLRDALGFIALGGLTAPLINATLSTLFGYWAGLFDLSMLERNWGTIWLGDSMGILVVAPLLLTLPMWNLRNWHIQRSPEALIWLVLLWGISTSVFCTEINSAIAEYPLEYLPFPFVIWGALRFGLPGATFSSFLVSSIAIAGTLQGNGPLLYKAGANGQVILLLQAFMSVIASTALVLAAAVAERQQTADLLRRSEASLANAQRIARLGHWDFDFTQNHWRWSDELYRLLGFAPYGVHPSQEVFLQVVHPDDRERVRQAIDKALKERRPYSHEYRLILPDTSERFVCEQVAVWSTGITGTVQDITPRKQAEEQLQLTAERDRLLSEIALRIRRSLDLAEVLNTTVDEVRQFLHADRVFISRYNEQGDGKVVAESVVAGWTPALGWTTSPEVYQEIQEVFQRYRLRVIHDTAKSERTPFLQDYHRRFQVRAGISVPIMLDNHLFGVLVANQCSGPRYWQPLEVDLLDQLATQVAIAIQHGQLYQQVQTLNANLEQQVAERTDQLQQKMRELQDLNQLRDVFLHAVSHDLRTTVMGTLLVLRNMQSQPGEMVSICRSMLERMIYCGEVQLNKLNSLLEAYTSKTKGVVLDCERVPLATLIQTVVDDLEPLFQQNQVMLVNQIPSGLPLVMADLAQLRRVFEHLLTNAVKHNPPGVQVTLTAIAEPNLIRCTVEDNGVGMCQEQCDRIFDLRIGGPNDRQLTGISLGLYLCQQIVTAHGGEIGVISTPGSGSLFWLTIPIAVPSSTTVSALNLT